MACIDGTTLEGGGQLLRISVGLAALTAEPIRITRIRANRRGKSGLKAQHLSAVQWLALASRAISAGAEQQSQTLDFFPRADVRGEIKSPQKANIIDIGSAGSIGLVFQAVLPFILFSGRPSNKPFAITIHGGTNVSLSPSYDYIHQVLLPTLSLIGLPPITANLHQRGWMRGPKGSITFTVTSMPRSQTLPPFRLENRGPIGSITATILAPSYCQGQAERKLHSVLAASFPHLDPQAGAFAVTFEKSSHKDLYLLLVATSSTGHRLGRDWLYNEKITAVPAAVDRLIERVARELVEEVRHGGCVDAYLRDQLVVFQGLADAESFVDGGRDEHRGGNVAPSLHARTAEWVVEKILGARFDGAGGCRGVGFKAGERYSERARAGGERCVRRAASLGSLKDRKTLFGFGDEVVAGRALRRSMTFDGESSRSWGSRFDTVESPSFNLPLRSRRLPSAS
ncbi:rna 3-terminal phosphate cyclase [Diplodia corticola]|uniref:Rna 3-terminal phosphate cyclase n=1 Tax=Diplodia corticola TaxID=236234 RepID=A0A1J9RV47_9PEZI|nr:rna 3-terminal phosphate cyclase [Diplodia corticola]OJD31381.1 rna 3-terminal phosphate cyclase [Diplodia corticola]